MLPEIDGVDNSQVTRMVLCGGKVYYELLEARRKLEIDHIAIVRIEQLYPLPEMRILAELDKYPNLSEVIWTQEEPLNQGAWYYLLPELYRLTEGRVKLLPASGRPAAAAPATGSPKIHMAQQKALIAQGLGVSEEQL